MTASPPLSPVSSPSPHSSAASQGSSASGQDVPHSFVCPISQEIMQDPVFASDGFTYDRPSIEAWFASGHTTSPMTQEELEHTHLTTNRTLRSEILNARSYVRGQSWGNTDTFDSAPRPRTVQPNTVLPAPSPAPRIPQVLPNALLQPKYEDTCVLIDDLRTELLRVTQELAPLGMAYKSVKTVGRCAVITLSRRLSPAEAQSKLGYEYLNILTLDHRMTMSQASEALCRQGWSFERFENDKRLMKTCFKRPMTGPAGMCPVYEEMSTLTADNINDMADNAQRMRDGGWSYQRFQAKGRMQKLDYRRLIPGEHGQVTIAQEKTSSICEDNINVIARVADDMAAQNWSFDTWDSEKSGLMVLHFKRNIIAKSNGDMLSSPGLRTRTLAAPAPLPTPSVPAPSTPVSRFSVRLRNPFRR